MQSYLLKPTFKIFLLSSLILSVAACNDDDDTDDIVPPPPRTEGIMVNFEGTVYNANTIVVEYFDAPEALDLTGSFDNGGSAGIGMEPIPPVGTYPSALNLAFAMTIGQDAWFCNEDCVVEILELDRADRWIKIRVTGAVSDLFGVNSAELTEARFDVFY